MSLVPSISVANGLGYILPAPGENGFTAPEGTHVLCIGSNPSGYFTHVARDDSFQFQQSANFQTSEILALRARTRGPLKIPLLIHVGSTLDNIPYIITINGTDFSYLADDAPGLSFASGSTASIDSREGTQTTVSGLTGLTTEAVGRQLELVGAADGNNNGTFTIDEIVNATTVKIRNALGVPGDANNGAIDWDEHRRPDNNTTIVLALRDLINVSGEPMTASARMPDGILQLENDDEDDSNVVTVSHAGIGSIGLHTIEWKFRMTVDGVAHFVHNIESKGRVRDLFDGGTLLTDLSAGNHTLAFQLKCEIEPILPGGVIGMAELEIPAVYVDELVFTPA